MLLAQKHSQALWLIGFYSLAAITGLSQNQSVPNGCPTQSDKMSKCSHLYTAGSAGSQNYKEYRDVKYTFYDIVFYFKSNEKHQKSI